MIVTLTLDMLPATCNINVAIGWISDTEYVTLVGSPTKVREQCERDGVKRVDISDIQWNVIGNSSAKTQLAAIILDYLQYEEMYSHHGEISPFNPEQVMTAVGEKAIRTGIEAARNGNPEQGLHDMLFEFQSYIGQTDGNLAGVFVSGNVKKQIMELLTEIASV